MAINQLGFVGRFFASALLLPCIIGNMAEAGEPPPQVAVVVDGIGFPYVPERIDTNCVADTCQLSTVYDRVRLLVRYPSDLTYSGSACYVGKIERAFDFHLVGSGTKELDAIQFDLESNRCPGRRVTLTFSALNWSDADWVRSNIILASMSLYVCVSPTRMTHECGEGRLVQTGDADKLSEIAAAWIRTRSDSQKTTK